MRIVFQVRENPKETDEFRRDGEEQSGQLLLSDKRGSAQCNGAPDLAV
jgi:hypothetical protein